MKKYLLKRFIILIPTFFGITILVYVISSLAPGTALDMLLQDPFITEQDLERQRVLLGLDQPVFIQYFKWLGGILQGDFGYSYRTNQKVLNMILERLGPTLLLTGTATLISLIIAIPVGILAAYKPNSFFDYLSSGLAFLGAATPNFFVGLIFIYLFCVQFGALPMGGMYDSSGNRSLGMLLKHMILPVSVFSIQQIGSLIRHTRGSLLEILQEDYIITARAKGLKETIVVLKHGLRNSLIPVVTVLSSMLPFIIGGAVVTEQIFSWPGLGSLMVLSINARDYPTIMGVTTIIAITVLFGNFIADIVYGILDPKIRTSR